MREIAKISIKASLAPYILATHSSPYKNTDYMRRADFIIVARSKHDFRMTVEESYDNKYLRLLKRGDVGLGGLVGRCVLSAIFVSRSRRRRIRRIHRLLNHRGRLLQKIFLNFLIYPKSFCSWQFISNLSILLSILQTENNMNAMGYASVERRNYPSLQSHSLPPKLFSSP